MKFGNKKLSNTIIKAIKHSNLTLPINKKFQNTTALTGEDFPPFSRHSTETLNPKFLSVMPPYKNTLFSGIACQTHSNRCSDTTGVTRTLPQIFTICYMKSKLKTKNVTCIKTCPTIVRQRNTTNKKKITLKKSQILLNMFDNIISNNFYNNLHHLGNDIIAQVDNGNTKTKQLQRTPNVRRTQSIQVKSQEISSPSKLFHSTLFLYFSGTCVSRSRSHLRFTVTLSFYVLFLGLTFAFA